MLTPEHIRQSNLIEGVDDPAEDARSWSAWQWLVDQSAITLDVVLGTHRRITAGQMVDAGILRQVNVRVGRRVCARWQHVPTLLGDWLAKMQDPLGVGPIQAHVGFERIHPFRDGNGRTGRMILWWHQIRVGEEPILLRAKERGEYYRWFWTDEEQAAWQLELMRLFRSPRGDRG